MASWGCCHTYRACICFVLTSPKHIASVTFHNVAVTFMVSDWEFQQDWAIDLYDKPPSDTTKTVRTNCNKYKPVFLKEKQNYPHFVHRNNKSQGQLLFSSLVPQALFIHLANWTLKCFQYKNMLLKWHRNLPTATHSGKVSYCHEVNILSVTMSLSYWLRVMNWMKTYHSRLSPWKKAKSPVTTIEVIKLSNTFIGILLPSKFYLSSCLT